MRWAAVSTAKGCSWADLSLTGEEDTDTWPLAHRIGAKIYKRYRYYEKEVCSSILELIVRSDE